MANTIERSLLSSDMAMATTTTVKGTVLPYFLSSVGPGADRGAKAVSPQVTITHLPGGRLPLLSARPAVTFQAEERHLPSASTKLYSLVTEAHGCEQLAQRCYLTARWRGSNLRPLSQTSNALTTRLSTIKSFYCRNLLLSSLSGGKLNDAEVLLLSLSVCLSIPCGTGTN